MIFYTFDDKSEAEKQYKINRNAQYKSKWADAYEVDRVNGDSEKCPTCGRHISSLRWLEPRKIRLTNTNYPDRLSWWILNPMIISERFKDEYHKEGMTGVSQFIPADVVKTALAKDNSPKPPRYYCAEIPFITSVFVDNNLSEITGDKSNYQCELCNPSGLASARISKLVFNAANWDGTDIFKVYSLGGYYVSQRFYDFCQKYKFTNMNLIPLN